jgi:hypothetical protein
MPAEERGHFALYRKLLTVRNEGDQIVRQEAPNPIGPLAIYRRWRRGDREQPDGRPAPDLRTSDPKTGEPMDLVEVWRPGEGDEV